MEIEMDPESKKEYQAIRDANPSETLTLLTQAPIQLSDLTGSHFQASIRSKDSYVPHFPNIFKISFLTHTAASS